MSAATFDVVIPTVGRPSLTRLLDSLFASRGPLPERLIVVDDRTVGPPLDLAYPGIHVARSGGRGPAAARNQGWQRAGAEWVVFLDDDVIVTGDWRERLHEDLMTAPRDAAGIQGRLEVPLPGDRPPTDWERNVAGLASARWITADMAYRRRVLQETGGFDERFRRAYREDADLALRVLGAGYRLRTGSRRTLHPVGPADRWVSIRMQAGNADDVLMRRLHGPGWRRRADAPGGRRPLHLLTTAALFTGGALAAVGRRKRAALAAASWTCLTAEFAWRRIAPGPRTADEVATMLLTSAVIPVAATYHWARGMLLGGLSPSAPWRPPGKPRSPLRAVLFDRDGTLITDVPYNGDPERVQPMPSARRALRLLRRRGIATAVISNQSGVARGLIDRSQVEAVNARVEQVLGPLGPWLVCTHGPDDGCDCRKPQPGLVIRAARALGVEPHECAVIGDIGADVEAALAAGARAVMVPQDNTRPEEIAGAPRVAPDLESAVRMLLEESK